MGTTEEETILECNGILIIPTIILMFCSVVNCLGSCLEIRIQSRKLESIKVVLFGNIQRSEFAKDFPVILLCNVWTSSDDSWVERKGKGEGPDLKCPISSP